MWSKIQTADPAAGVGLLLTTPTPHLWITHLQASFRGEINFTLILASVVLHFLSLLPGPTWLLGYAFWKLFSTPSLPPPLVEIKLPGTSLVVQWLGICLPM